MRRLLTIALLLAPICASAEHLDVIQGKLREKCTLETYIAIKNDFNDQWGKSHGYRAEIASAVTLQRRPTAKSLQARRPRSRCSAPYRTAPTAASPTRT